MRTGIAEELQRRQHRRRIEYLVILSALSVVVGFHGSEFRLQTATGVALSCLGMSWTLTQMRLRRRSVPAATTMKETMDGIERLAVSVLVILFLVAVVSFPERRQDIAVWAVLACLCLVFGTFSTEEFWIRRFFTDLPTARQCHFLQHFHPSLLRSFRGRRMSRTLQWNSLLG
ncbi:MAG: hypothetical protein ACKOAX_02045 [Candidatus Kapaibacterium sp.]